MNNQIVRVALVFLFSCFAVLSVSAKINEKSFLTHSPKDVEAFIQSVSKKHAIDKNELKSLFVNANVQSRVLELIARPYEAKPWFQYHPIFVTDKRAKAGVKFWEKHTKLINEVSKTYGVPPEIIIAIIGVETYYGQHTGKFKVFDSVATLAFAYPKRAEFFKKELEQLILLMREQNLSADSLYGSYAGAMGMPQFIASSYRNYAVDFNKDGKTNLLSNHADVFGSVANYFKRHEWQDGKIITVKVSGPEATLSKLAVKNASKPKLTVKELKAKGVNIPNHIPEMAKANILKLDLGNNQFDYWLGLNNFYVITRYNHSIHYAMAVYQLGHKIKQLKKKA